MAETPEMPEELPLADVAAVIAQDVRGGTPTSQNRDVGHPAVEAGEIDANEVETKEETPMFDVHPAHHAASSWKEFSIHIATIVLGLLIAVGLEQAVEWVRHRREVAAVREELREEREHNKDAFKYETARSGDGRR